jgi:hypothetical protein
VEKFSLSEAIPVIKMRNEVKLPLFFKFHSVVYGNTDLQKFFATVLK